MTNGDEAPIYIDEELSKAARSLSLGARGMLIMLIMRAALRSEKTLPVNQAFLRSLASSAKDRRDSQKRFCELTAARFVRRVESGAYLIAPEWWRFEEEMDDPD